MISVFLFLGSNIGDRVLFLEKAIAGIEKHAGHIVKKSDVYETPAWGKTDEPDYLNQVLMVETLHKPHDLLRKLLDIELELGRERKEKWGSRTIDIDILFYGDEIINDAVLTVPHPQLHKRKFTLEPMSQIAPDYVHPVLHKTIAELNEQLDN